VPEGREAGFARPAVVVTAQRVLDRGPSVIHVVPLTSTVRSHESEVVVEPDGHTGLRVRSVAQSQHVRSVAAGWVGATIGNVGPESTRQIRETLALVLDLPG